MSEHTVGLIVGVAALLDGVTAFGILVALAWWFLSFAAVYFVARFSLEQYRWDAKKATTLLWLGAVMYCAFQLLDFVAGLGWILTIVKLAFLYIAIVAFYQRRRAGE